MGGEYDHSVGRYDVVTHVDSTFVRMFIWERFAVVGPKPVGNKLWKGEVVFVEGLHKMKPTVYEPRAGWWLNVK